MTKKMRFKDVTAVLMNTPVFCVVTSSRLVNSYRRFGGTFYLCGQCQDYSTIPRIFNHEIVGNMLLRNVCNWA
jgi:hypothetical protein